MNETARAEAEKVLNRMKQEGQEGHEYGMLYDYLDFVTGLVWKKEPPAEIDLEAARKVLDEDHFGLKKTKDRIIQQIAVMALNKKQSGSILLFVGLPEPERPVSGRVLPKHCSVNMYGSAWAASATRRKSAATGAPISARCRGVLWMESGGAGRLTRLWFWTRWTNW